MYEESYPRPPLEMKDRHTKNDIQKQLLQLRSSNILMGSEGQDYNSIHMEDYLRWGTQGAEKAKPSYDLKATHYKIGTDTPVYDSSARADFYWKDPEIGNGQNKELMKDLRCKFQLNNSSSF